MKRTNSYLPAIIVILGLLFSSCASNYNLNTSSGRADVIIYNVEKKDVVYVIINSLLSAGYSLKSQNEYNLVMTKRYDNPKDVGVALLMGSQYDPFPEHRVSFNLLNYSNGIRIITDVWMVTNPGSAFERITNLSTNSRMAYEYQIYLNEIKSSLEKSAELRRRGKIGVSVEKNQIVNVVEGSNAEQAGLLMGDIILFIDGVPITESTSDYMMTMMITGEPGTTVSFIIQRGKQKMEISVVRGQP